MDRDASAGVRDRDSRRTNQIRARSSRAGSEEQDRPADGRGDKRQAPPPPEYQSEENESGNHRRPIGCGARSSYLRWPAHAVPLAGQRTAARLGRDQAVRMSARQSQHGLGRGGPDQVQVQLNLGQSSDKLRHAGHGIWVSIGAWAHKSR